MSQDEVESLMMNPKTRRLIKIVPSGDNEKTHQTLKVLMGRATAGRKELYKYVENDTIEAALEAV
jgi:DNA gyrase/topoisomerase IV subunit B